MSVATVFLLSPARCGGERAEQLVRSKRSELGAKLRAKKAEVGDVFAWLSALYFRGKLTYARRFGIPLVMVPGIGLRPPELLISSDDLRAMGKVDIESASFARTLRADAEIVAQQAADAHDARIVLLGSIATSKYVATLLDVLGDRLLFPDTFVGRGDMSRGGLMLRAARSGDELTYCPIAGAIRHGARPAKLPRLPRHPTSSTTR